MLISCRLLATATTATPNLMLSRALHVAALPSVRAAGCHGVAPVTRFAVRHLATTTTRALTRPATSSTRSVVFSALGAKHSATHFHPARRLLTTDAAAAAAAAASTTTPVPPRSQLTAIPANAAAAIQYDLGTHLPSVLTVPQADGGATLHIKLYPARPVESFLVDAASELGAEHAAIYSVSSAERVRWCRSTPLADVVADGLRHEMKLELVLDHGKRTIVVELPSLTERAKALRETITMLTPKVDAAVALKQQCDTRALRSANLLVWGGFGALCAQWGLMARLTWWEYSWDVMEPISYFVTFGTGILGYMFYTVTRRDYTYELMTDLHVSRKQAALYRRAQLDVRQLCADAEALNAARVALARVEAEYGQVDGAMAAVEGAEGESAAAPTFRPPVAVPPAAAGKQQS
ncbi:hypothetical protein AMAG_10639 [Allomyces macrogynus ATCC 38327]|uniref:Calcium uniporter protein, mitochondrial n=1 Tax=Allomyces macrogynus (strain ATCC 38327) TaxID=578462 RepID=A0A0L0SR30_ALLM3|nr:hypothetical protein AMAG_10639 [Allomyces macrogynus ATCC 38327]|eukprot:KNE64973.1 hypothetical protein AMAG_10639 [Allomyces macrogynus ATCC 38327]